MKDKFCICVQYRNVRFPTSKNLPFNETTHSPVKRKLTNIPQATHHGYNLNSSKPNMFDSLLHLSWNGSHHFDYLRKNKLARLSKCGTALLVHINIVQTTIRIFTQILFRHSLCHLLKNLNSEI